MENRRDHCLMGIVPFGKADSRCIARRALAPFGDHEQRTRQDIAIFEFDANSSIISLGTRNFSGHVQRDFGPSHGAFVKSPTDKLVFEHLPQIAIAFFRHEIERAGFEAVADPNLLDRATFAGKCGTEADRFEQFHARTGNGGYAAIEMRRQHGRLIGPVDDMAGDAMHRKCKRLGKAVQPATNDDNVGKLCLGHGNRLGRFSMAEKVRKSADS